MDASTPGTESGLVKPVSSLHDFVARWRPKVDRITPRGVPAHITVLYPFLPPSQLDDETGSLVSFFAGEEPFEYRLESVG